MPHDPRCFDPKSVQADPSTGDWAQAPMPEGIDSAARETIALLRSPTQWASSVTPGVDRLISRLSRLGEIVGTAVDALGDGTAARATPNAKLSQPDSAGEKELPLVPDFRIVRTLGSGGMGTVYLAEELALARRVALKVIRGGLAEDSSARARFLREARAMAAVVHDNVMPVHRVGECEAGLYFATPLLPGETLASRLERADGPLPAAEALAIFRQIAAGLDAIHRHGVVHRDIKPSNIWLESTADAAAPRVRILDFGVALDLAPPIDSTLSCAVLGTPGYMAPEQAAGSHVDGRADLFALGAVGYRMWTGRPAFRGDTLFQLLTQLAIHDPPPAKRVNPEMEDSISRLLERLLSKEPEDRPATATEVLATEVLASVSQGSHSETRRPLAVRTAVIWLFVATIAAAIVITIVNSRDERALIDVPDGANVKVSPNGNVEVKTPRTSDHAGQPRAADKFAPLDAAWLERFATLGPDEQRGEVAAELRKRNPDYRDTPYRSNSERQAPFSNLGVFTDHVSDITPLRAARGLTHVQLVPSTWSQGGRGRLESLEALRGLKLEFLDLQSNSKATDLSPLEGMTLNWLNLTGTGVRDLTSLRNVTLTGGLLLERTAVTDLSPIAGQALVELALAETAVKDLTPLAGMRLKAIALPKGAGPWTVLADMPLEKLSFAQDDGQDTAVFRRMTTLKEINGMPVADFWKARDE